MAPPQETIAALATAPGRAGVGIVRISGPLTRNIAGAVLGGTPKPRHARYGPFKDHAGSNLDSGIALFFPAPNSFTGEDVLELQGHGGPVVMDMVLQRVVVLGARLARPGEFTQRAFLNNKLDLAQAEAIADLIDSASEQAARSAQRSLQGEFSRRVHELTEGIVALRTHVEAAIDFPEDEIDFLEDKQLNAQLQQLLDTLSSTLAAARQGNVLREGLTVVIAGRPNVGKSSLLNRLSGKEAAIVTDIPGTTRDVLREYIQLDGLPLHVLDTAGLRCTEDRVEQHGVRRAWDAIGSADAVLLVVDDCVGKGAEEEAILSRLPEGPRRIVVRNKIDLSGRPPGCQGATGEAEIWLSARTGEGLDTLKALLKTTVGYEPPAEGSFIARRRHLDALERSREALESARGLLQSCRSGELVAEELRQGHLALGEIVGEFTSEDLLDRIFAGFCIGK